MLDGRYIDARSVLIKLDGIHHGIKDDICTSFPQAFHLEEFFQNF